MEDLISRQAAIEAISTWDKFGVDERSRIVRWYEGLEPYVRLRDVVTAISYLPSAQTEIVYCKDCVKHNKARGYFYDGTLIGIKDCCPLVEIRGKAQGHEFDYQYCAYAERRTDESDK